MDLPHVPDSFYWTNESWGAALRCRPLDAVAQHLFTTRRLTLETASDYEQMARALGADDTVTVNQVHGTTVCVIRSGSEVPRGRQEADILVSNDPAVAIAVRAADCVPLLMADRRTGAVAAVHAGWRGTASKAAAVAVQSMRYEFGTAPLDLVVAIGPSIGACCYQVGSDVVDAFAAAGHERHLIERWFATPPPPRGSFQAERTRLRLDVAGANRDQLILAGVGEDNIHMSGLCTAMNLALLTSFRAEKENAGRIAGVIRCGHT